MAADKLIIIGAGRSGTNILRDTLTQIAGWETWDCDEINLIWRHKNINMPHDVLGVDHARPEVADYIRSAFDKLDHAQSADVIVEKTCANSLRVPFINHILPEAKYLYIVRDGRDVSLSAARRWTASVEPRYILKKIRYAPLLDIPHYAVRFLSNRWNQMRSDEKRQALWGPVLPDMRDEALRWPLLEICARQWAGCVNASDSAFENIDDHRVYKIYYEDLVSAPEETLAGFLDWFGASSALKEVRPGLSGIRPQRQDGWKRHLKDFSPRAIDLMAKTLERHRYDTSA